MLMLAEIFNDESAVSVGLLVTLVTVAVILVRRLTRGEARMHKIEDKIDQGTNRVLDKLDGKMSREEFKDWQLQLQKENADLKVPKL